MKIYKNFNVSKKFESSAIAIGNFDGFHLGHQKVIKSGKYLARKHKLKFGLLVFHPLPVMFFNKKIKTSTVLNFIMVSVILIFFHPGREVGYHHGMVIMVGIHLFR